MLGGVCRVGRVRVFGGVVEGSGWVGEDWLVGVCCFGGVEK